VQQRYKGNIVPRDIRLAINDVVNEIYENYFSDLSRATNRKNRGLINSMNEDLSARIHEKLMHYLVPDYTLTYDNGAGVFNLPDDYRYIDSAYYLNYSNEIDFCKSMKEFKLINNYVDTRPTELLPVAVKLGETIKVAPSTIQNNVKLSYLRKPVIANWAYIVVSGAELVNLRLRILGI
jgi:hypothetical protein